MTISTVALVLDMSSLTLFEGLARCMPVWVADTPANAALREVWKADKQHLCVTWFPVHEGEELERAATRICFSLDDHYNELAQSEGYKTLLVFGVPYSFDMHADLVSVGFQHMESVSFGFVASKVPVLLSLRS